MKSKISIISLALTVAAILALVNVGSAPSSASRSASAEPVGVAIAANSTVPLTPVGSGFTYQGSLKSGGSPANGQYDFQFTLYDALTGGNLVSGPVTTANVTVAGGLFTVTLDFGPGFNIVFQGEARYLEIAVRQTGGGTYTNLTPRQPLTPVPYALSLKPGAVISSETIGSVLTALDNSTGSIGWGVYGSSINARGVYGRSTNGYGVEGSSINGYGVYGSANDVGVWGQSSGGKGVVGISTSYWGVYGSSTSSYGVYGSSTNSQGMVGYSSNNEGVHGETGSNYAAVEGNNIGGGGIGPGVRGDSASGPGVYGLSPGNKGVWGVSTTNDGVYGTSDSSSGVAGISNSGNGVYGRSSTGYAGWFDGNVRITGSCCSASVGTYQIDHPLDPANKYLNQAAVESQDMLDMINGNATTDAQGNATVTLPAYFEAVNRDFRYQLTVVGDQFAQVRVSSKLKDNNFSIKTDKPSVEISWQVTGVRNDPYAQQHPLTAEQAKPANEKGYYLHPDLYGQPNSKSVDPEVRNPPTAPAQPVQPKSAPPGGK